ncbi:MAG: helix-turn-helix transcriptional regulator [Rhodobacteraceae bacterium]|nr:helix-turn-helix transcriptional regulator [Paracoccaceae bacterium]
MNGVAKDRTSVRSASIAEADIIGGIALWCDSVQGRVPVIEAMEAIARGVGAEAVDLARVSKDTRSESKSIIFDVDSHHPGRAALDRSYARSVLGDYFDRSRTGTIWFKSMVEIDPDPALAEFHRRRRFAELAIIPLAVNEKTVDFIELHFPRKLTPDCHALLNMMVSTLTRTWANRKAGLLTDAMLRRKRSDSTAWGLTPILGSDNPAKLSRAEFRVCLLLSRGLSNKRVQSELEISNSTLRTHLRNIYTKTGTSGQAELLYHLLARVPAVEHLNARIA